MKKNNVIFLLVLGLLLELILIINQQEELSKMKNQQVNLSSKNYYNKENNQETDNNLSEVEVVENNTETGLEDTEKHFFTLYPVIDLETLAKKYYSKAKVIKKDLTLKEKKENFINEILPAINQSRKKLLVTYQSILSLQGKKLSIQDEEYLNLLYQTYRIKNGNIEDLLIAVKPHPTSVILAQAILESGWGTSRFYKEANNIFGIWSFNSQDERIKVKGADNVYLKKYDSFVESVDDYMLMLSRNTRYLDFRKARFETDDPFELIKHLKNYSELREEYIRRLRIVIKANHLTKFDKEIKDSEIIDIEM
jgi:Bax protein